MAYAGDLRVDVRSDLKFAVARLEARTQKAIDAATVTALNRTAATVRAEAVRRIRERYNIRASVVRGQIRIVRASRTVKIADIIATGRKIPLIEFAARQTKPGVTVKVLSGGARKLLRHVFIARMRSGHVGVYERKGRERLPIRQLFSISLPQTFTRREIIAALKKTAAERFRIELARALKYGGS